MSGNREPQERRRARKHSGKIAGIAAASLAVVGAGTAAVAGAFSARSAYSSLPQANPVSPQMIKTVADGALRVFAVPPMSGNSPALRAIPRDIAERAALSQLHRPGSAVLGRSLAYVKLPGDGGEKQLAWLISLNPAGGLLSVQAPGRLANYCVAIVNAANGKWLMTTVGHSPTLPALPARR